MSLPLTQPLLYLITDRRKTSPRKNETPGAALLHLVERAIAAGVDLVQIREPDLSGRELFALTQKMVELARGSKTRVLVNDRADIAACAGAGVHRTTRSLPVAVLRKTFGEDLLIGASTHSLEEAQEAAAGGANFIVFGPVFATASKMVYGAPVGCAALREVVAQVNLPVLAIGGIDLTNFSAPMAAGASGLAAISLFAEAEDLGATREQIKQQWRAPGEDAC
ncbi:MAG: thiamine phosphate synthase [Acidobacteria bacterium]|nr:thiamine phosphate synthase [Acidobacteriota bacterium]